MCGQHARALVPIALLLIAALGIATAFPLGALAVVDGSPIEVSSVRYLSAVLIIAALGLGRRGRALAVIPGSARPAIAAMGMTIALFNLCFLAALQLLHPSAGALIIAGAMPITTWALASIRFGEKVRARQFAGFAAALMGIVIVFSASGNGKAEDIASEELIGAILYAISGIIWGANSVISQVALRYVDPHTGTFWSLVSGLAVLLPLAAIADGPLFLAHMGRSIWFAALLGLVSTAIPFLCLLAAIRRIGAARAAAGTFLVPVFAVVLDLLLLGRGLSTVELVGGALTILGFVLITSSRRTGTTVASGP